MDREPNEVDSVFGNEFDRGPERESERESDRELDNELDRTLSDRMLSFKAAPSVRAFRSEIASVRTLVSDGFLLIVR